VIGDDGLVLHQGDDDEPTAVGEGADLERHPTGRYQISVSDISFRFLRAETSRRTAARQQRRRVVRWPMP
jgi:hypothetical protein